MSLSGGLLCAHPSRLPQERCLCLARVRRCWCAARTLRLYRRFAQWTALSALVHTLLDYQQLAKVRPVAANAQYESLLFPRISVHDQPNVGAGARSPALQLLALAWLSYYKTITIVSYTHKPEANHGRILCSPQHFTAYIDGGQNNTFTNAHT